MDELIPDYHDFYCFHKGYHVISIYHTAYYAFYTDERMKVIGYMLRYALDNPSKRIEKKQLELYISIINSNYSLAAKQTSEGDFLECNNNTIKDRAQQLKAMIKSNGSKQWIYKDILVHEYFTDVSEITGKYINYKFSTNSNKINIFNKRSYFCIFYLFINSKICCFLNINSKSKYSKSRSK